MSEPGFDNVCHLVGFILKFFEAFLVVMGCRIVDGREGRFISWPATKNEKTGKYWNHVWAGEAFAAAVLAEAEKTQPRSDAPSRGKPAKNDVQDSVPF